MTQEILGELLFEQYQLVKVLKKTDKKNIEVLRHKTLKKDVVKRSFNGNAEIYTSLQKIKHINLPTIYDVYTDNDKIIVLEEFIKGQTISDVLECGLFKLNGVKKITSELCNVLEVVHSLGIIHRDIKPENIIIDDNGVTKLIDFDVSKFYNENKSEDTTILGTIGYAAPEQFGFNQSDIRTDIYALGVLMNVMLTGEHPSKLLHKGKYTKIISKCLQIDPAKRYQSTMRLKADL